MNKSTLAGAAMIAVAAVTVPAVVAWSQSPQSARPGAASGDAAGPAGPGDMGREGMMHHGWDRSAHISPQQACTDRLARRAGFVASIG
ncbi:MAG TPA: hypothetical protein VM782_16050, partial [Stellaceae bacterium]|nr:hypothetical protein [Stellaceae bacterium]